MMYTYYKLTSIENNGMIVRVDNSTRYEDYFNVEARTWQPIGIMMRYFWPDSDTFEMYEELSGDKVMEAIS